jgi:hypothetical protein
MSIASIERRLGALEAAWPSTRQYPVLTPAELSDIARRIQSGEEPTKVELDRIERQSPITHGEFLMTCYHGQLFVKRYIGVDLSEL